MFYTLIEQAELRNKLIDRVDVLNKVKELFLIPKLEMITGQMVADFYETDYEVIRKCYHRNREEINQDGAIIKTSKEIREEGQNVPAFKKVSRTAYSVKLSNDVEYEIPNKIVYFTPRAVLRISMPLRDSEVAKEVQTKMYRFFTYKMIWVCLEMTGLVYSR